MHPQAPFWLPYLWYCQERRACSRHVPGLEGTTAALLCIKQSLGAPVLSSNPCLQPLSTNIYVHVGPGINGGNSLAYQWKPLSKFWKALMVSIQILFNSVLCNRYHRAQQCWDLPPPVGVWFKTRCPASIFLGFKSNLGHCGLNQYPHSEGQMPLSTEWEVKWGMQMGAKTDLTHACQQVARKPQCLSFK